MEKLKARWGVESNWGIVAIFFGFAINGSLAAFVVKPILKLIGINKDNLSTGLYLLLYILPVFIIYQFTLPYSGWIVGQFKFFKNFQLKMLNRFGLGKLFKEKK